jgi:hypothetical protein
MNPDVILALDKSLTHLLSSGFSGLSAYFLTLTIFSFYYKKAYPLLPKISSLTAADRSIYLLSFSLGLFASIVLHLYIDYVIVEFEWWIFRH